MLSSDKANIDILKELVVLYVEDDEYAIEGLEIILSKKVKKIYTAINGQAGLEIYKNHHIDIVITDIRMPIMNGIEMVKEIKKINSNAKIIYVSAHNEEDVLLQAIDAGADGFIIKPLTIRTKLMFALTKVAKDIYKDNLIKKYNETIKLILNCVDSLIIVSNGKEILEANSSFLDFVGFSELSSFKEKYKCICERFIEEEGFLKSIYLDNETWIDMAINATNAKAKMRNQDGEIRIFLVKPTPLVMNDNDVTYVVNFTDITDIENEKQELYKQASKDVLTHIFNRNSFNMFFEKQLAHYQRTKEIFCILFFDIDNFKKVNDNFGHQEGDNVLKDIANIVKHRIRDTDIFARWGGEEFVLILPNTNTENAKILAESLRKNIQDYKFTIQKEVTCSFGLVQINKNTQKEDIIIAVDKALYVAKNNGKNRVEIGTL